MIRMIRRSTAWVLLSAFTFLGASSASGADWQGREVERDGAVHVMNPAEPMEPPVTIELRELWRVGGETESEEEFFGVISRVEQNREGDVFLLDSQLSEIKVFSPEGTYLRTIGREGEGPGEFRNAADMFIGPGGNVGVVQIWPGKIVRMTQQGDPLDNFPLPEVEGGGFQLVFLARGLDDRIVLAGSQQRRGDGEMLQVKYLKAFDADGNEIAHYHSESRPTRYGGMKFEEETFIDFQRRWALAPDGRVAAALEFHEYALHVWNPDGTLQRVIHRDYSSLEKGPAERRLFQKLFEAITRWNPNSTFELSDEHMDVNQVFFRDDGSLWVLSSRGVYDRPEGILASFDVFDAQGRFVQQVRLRGRGNPAEDGIYFLGDRFYVVTSQLTATLASLGVSDDDEESEEEPEPVSMICYRLDGSMLSGMTEGP